MEIRPLNFQTARVEQPLHGPSALASFALDLFNEGNHPLCVLCSKCTSQARAHSTQAPTANLA